MDKLKDLLLRSAPALGTALGGPLGGAAIAILAEVLDVKPTPEAVEEAVASTDPNVLAASIARAEAAFKAEAARCQVVETQITQHVEMMKLDYSRGMFHGLWRPAAGWIAVLFAGASAFLSLFMAAKGDFTLLNMAGQQLMIGGPIMALAGVYALGKSNERVAMVNATPNIVDVAKSVIGGLRR